MALKVADMLQWHSSVTGALYKKKDMKSLYIGIFLVVINIFTFSTALATEFKLREFKYYGSSPGMELSLRPENASKLSEIFKVLEFSHDNFYIRLIGKSSQKTNSELLNYYKDHMSKELYIALNTARNTLHDPALKPLKNGYWNALKSTTLYSELKMELLTKGYKIIEISFEKFHIRPEGTISIPDTYLYISKNPK